MSIRIIIADDHKIIRDGLIISLENEKDIQVVGEADNGRQTLQLVQKYRPDLVIMDIAMPDLNGIEATKMIIKANLGTKIVALSMHSDKRYVIGMLQAGASGYLLKECAFKDLVNAVRSVMAGQIYLSPQIAGVIVKDYIGKRKKNNDSFQILSDREREVLQLLAEGKTSKEIAAKLFVSNKTVGTFRQRIMEKLDLHSIAELTKYAIREGLTSLDK